jgi:hypothetical protein
LAIQRRAVRTEIPVSRAMSRARRYSPCPVISAPPREGETVLRQARSVGRPIGERLAAPGGVQAPPARSKPGWRPSTDMGEHGPSPPECGNQAGAIKNGAIESIFVGAAHPCGCP